MSSRRETHQARWFGATDESGKIESLVYWMVPWEQFYENREALIETFGAIHNDVDVIDERTADVDNSDLRESAQEAGLRAPEHDPHPIANRLSATFEKLGTIWAVLSYILIIGGSLLSVNQVVRFGLGLRDLPDLLIGLFPPSAIALIGLVMYTLRADTFAHRLLNRELRVIGARLRTRHRSKLIGYKIWNDSLHGQSGLWLLMILFVIDSLPQIPVIGRRFDDPRGTLLKRIRENAEELYECDGWLEAARAVR